jgi:IS5 family transposase
VKQAPRRRRTPVKGLVQSLETMLGRVRQVVKQTKIRIFAGETKMPGKIVSVFEPHTEIIRKGKASKPNEFGKLVKIQEAENQIVTHFEVFAERPADSTLLLSSIEVHQQRLGRIPRMVAADAGFYSRENEKTGQALGVKWMSVPNKKTTSSERKCLQHQRWFRRGQKWRTGSEGRISVRERLYSGWNASGKNGYHGYAWRHTHTEADLYVWCHENAPVGSSLDLETVEAEIAFLIRSAGQWPRSQTEIHFHPSEKEHRELAARIVKVCAKAP